MHKYWVIPFLLRIWPLSFLFHLTFPLRFSSVSQNPSQASLSFRYFPPPPHFPTTSVSLKIQRALKLKMASLRDVLSKPEETPAVYVVKWFCPGLICQELQQKFSETWHLGIYSFSHYQHPSYFFLFMVLQCVLVQFNGII